MRNPLSRIATLDFWFEVSALVGLVGLVLSLLGLGIGVSWLIAAGMYLAVPIFAGSVVLVFALIPMVIVSRWKERGR